MTTIERPLRQRHIGATARPVLGRVAAVLVAAVAVIVSPSAGQTTATTATTAPTATTNTPVLRMPFESSADMVIVPVRINDSRVLRGVLDTGMPEGAFFFDPALGEELELEYVATVPLRGASAAQQTAHIAVGATITLGDITLDSQRVIVLEKASPLSKMGAECVIGASFFNRYVVELDFDAERLSFYEPAGFDAGAAGEAIPLSVRGQKPTVQAQVGLDADTTVSVTLIVDTGAGKALSLNTAAVPALAAPKKTIDTIVGSGVGGDIHGRMGRVSNLGLGSFILTRPVCQFPDEPQGSGDGILGMKILRRFVVTFDYASERMLLRPSASFDAPFEFNMAGLVLRPTDNGRLRIHSIIDASPATSSGLGVNDVIVAIDGRFVADLGDAAARRLLEQHGKTIDLSVERDGTLIEVSIELKRMI